MADKKPEWFEPAEDSKSFEKIKAMLDENSIKYKISEHKAVTTSE
jgi:Ala-tRNA(Pro) deacylase